MKTRRLEWAAPDQLADPGAFPVAETEQRGGSVDLVRRLAEDPKLKKLV